MGFEFNLASFLNEDCENAQNKKTDSPSKCNETLLKKGAKQESTHQ